MRGEDWFIVALCLGSVLAIAGLFAWGALRG
jgi:hypothetical protein